MKALIFCLYIATGLALSPGVYIVDSANNQFYNPLVSPHSKLNLYVGYTTNQYGVAQQFVTKALMCTAPCTRSVLRARCDSCEETHSARMTLHCEHHESRFPCNVSRAGR